MALVGYGIWAYVRAPAPGEEEPKETEDKSITALEESFKFFSDPTTKEVKTLYKTEADKRSEQVSDVSYRLAYALNRGGETFHGKVEVSFSLTKQSAEADDIFVDYRGDKVHSLEINGNSVTTGNPFRDHRIYFDKQFLKQGENKVQVRFTSNYTRDCQGVQYFKDKDDNEEYIYSDNEPQSCHKAFPCFDQPDMKASYRLLAVVPKHWNVFSNAPQVGATSEVGSAEFS